MRPWLHVIQQRRQLFEAFEPRMRAVASCIGAAALSLLLAACGTATNATRPAPAQALQTGSGLEREYRIDVGDQLDLKFFYNSELNEQVIVRPDGKIALQLIDETTAAGLTPKELGDILVRKYSQELQQPSVAVIVRSFAGRVVYVDGEVNRAGVVNFVKSVTVLQAVAQAGGIKVTGSPKDVVVIRRGADNKPVIIPVDVERAILVGDEQDDIVLRPFDIVYVPRSVIANLNVWVDQYIRQNIPIPFSIQYSVVP